MSSNDLVKKADVGANRSEKVCNATANSLNAMSVFNYLRKTFGFTKKPATSIETQAANFHYPPPLRSGWVLEEPVAEREAERPG